MKKRSCIKVFVIAILVLALLSYLSVEEWFTFLFASKGTVIKSTPKEALVLHDGEGYTNDINDTKPSKEGDIAAQIKTLSHHTVPAHPNQDEDSALSSCPVPMLPKRGAAVVMMVDRPAKLVIVGTPKGGATLTAQLMLRKLNMTETAREYHPWIHKHRTEVFIKKPAHRPVRCRDVCASGWVCAKLIRSALDRAASSYRAVVSKKNVGNYFPELLQVLRRKGKTQLNASFAEFIEALDQRSHEPQFLSMDAHFLPQAEEDCTTEHNVIPIPIEAVHDGLLALDQLTGVKLDATNLTSSHYGRPNTSGASNQIVVEDMSHAAYHQTDMIKSYASFFQNRSVNRVFCRAFCEDLSLYGQMCSYWRKFPGVEGVAAIIDACEAERQRVAAFCGPDYDFTFWQEN